MHLKLAFATLAVLFEYGFVSGESIPSTTTAAELWNPWTWFWPYAIASAEGYRDYYQKAQQATNELYQQIYSTNAFPWITGNWGGSTNPAQNGQGGQNQGGKDEGKENQSQGGQNGNQSQGGQNGNQSQGGQSQDQSQGGQSENQSQGGQSQDQSQGSGNSNVQAEGNVNPGNDNPADAQANVDSDDTNAQVGT